MKILIKLIIAFCLINLSCTPQSIQHETTQSQIDQIAESYIKLVLSIGKYDTDFVDSYFGPPEWKEQAAAQKIPLEDIRSQAILVKEKLNTIDISKLNDMERMRARFIDKQLDSIKIRVDILSGVKMKYDEESNTLYETVAQDYPDSYFEAQLAKVDSLIPGTGTIRERMDNYRLKLAVPRNKVEPVFRAALQEARLRTHKHIQLPEEENIQIKFVRGKPWGAACQYKGNNQGFIQVNTDLPYSVEDLLMLACHEIYPGHHVTHLLLDNRLNKERGWREFSIVPFPSTVDFLAEGTAEYALELAFPINERIAFERDVLYPLAGLDPGLAENNVHLYDAKIMDNRTEGFPLAVRRYLDGVTGPSETIEWLKAHTLFPLPPGNDFLSAMEQFRTYTICYVAGYDVVKHRIEKQAGQDYEKRWQEFERIQVPPGIPSDLR